MKGAVAFEAVSFATSVGLTPALTWSVPGPGAHAIVAPDAVNSSIVRSSLGLMPPAAGRILVHGKEPYRLSRRERAAAARRCAGWLLPPALLSNMTIRAAMHLTLMNDPDWSQADADRRIKEVLDACGISEWADLRPGDVTPPVRTRASLARALALWPDVIVTDDFAGRMNPDEAAYMITLCRRYVDVVLITTSAPHRIESHVDTLVTFADSTAVEVHA